MISKGALIILLAYSVNICNGHGYMWEPAGRSTAWRRGFDTPKNYDDNGINCGGLGAQEANGGKCGPCGDDYSLPTPRPNEYGGKYGKGVIVRQYNAGQDIEITVIITVNHGGWFEFRLCDDFKTTSNECLDKIVLKRADKTDETKFHLNRTENKVKMNYTLPEGFKCEHCVLQWMWFTASNFDPPQEQFKNCADISIL